MKKFFIILSMFVSPETINAQELNMQREIVSSFNHTNHRLPQESPVFNATYSLEPVEHWKKIRNTGRILTFAGAGTVVLSGLLAERSLNDAFSGRNGDGVFLGAASMVLGFIATGTGITMWTVGGIRHSKAKKQNVLFQQTSLTSAGLVYKF